MRRILLATCGALALTIGWHGLFPSADAQVPGGQGRPFGMAQPPRFPDFNTVVGGAKVHEGFFKLHHKEDKLYCEILPHQFKQPWLCSISVARGGGLGGHMLNFQEEWVLSFRREGDKVYLIRRNVHFKANAGSPVAKAVETTYTDSILMALRIATINMQTQGVLINLNDIFMTNFAELPFGMFDASRSNWHKIKTFPHNDELQVEATFAGGRFGRGGGTSIDGRGNTVLIHYGLVQLPDGGYQPRVADDRVGYFLSAVKDYSKHDPETSFVRYVRRWRLEPAEPIDPKNPTKLVAPKRKIVYWIEKSVPNEYRAYVREGILEWNKAFEKIGFRDVIEVRQQEDNEPSSDFDPEDVRYNTFRWITLDAGYAMGPSRANPLTGELIDADIVFDASMVQHWKQQYKQFTSSGEAIESPSLIRDAQRGVGMFDHPLFQRQLALDGWNDKPKSATELHQMRMEAIRSGCCQCASQMRYQMGLAAMVMAARVPGKLGTDKLPDELVGQAVKHVVMHEVGHTLGLRHNFKASTMLKNEQLNDTSITRKQGLVGSVMDYSPVNIAPKGVKQGDYFSQVLGPYDYWAIEYAYKPLQGNQEEELKKIASKIAQPGHEYGTDEDLYLNADPNINVWDLGSDPMKFGQDRMLLAEELLKDLDKRIVDKGEGYQRARFALSLLLRQFGDAAQLTVKHIGGEYVHRDHKDDPNARDPLVPVSGAKQREALKFLQEHILADKAFQFSPQLLKKLAVERWSHWGAGMSNPDYPIYDRILAIQQIVLSDLLDPTVLRRIQNNTLKAEKDEQPLKMAEVFRSLTDGVWNDLPNGAVKEDKKGATPSVIRRNLQREHLKDLSRIVLGRSRGSDSLAFMGGGLDFGGGGSAAPPDARSLARMHLREINKKIETALGDKPTDETTRAHLEECHERITKVLNASMQVND